MPNLRAVAVRLALPVALPVALLLSGDVGGTQPRPIPAGVTAPRDTASAGRKAAAWHLDQCMAGLTYGAPLKWAAAYGMGLVREYDASDVCLLAAAKVGLGGAGLHLGMANAFGMFGGGTAVTVGMLRTFNRPLDAVANRTYVGGSLHGWPVAAIGGEVGWYTRVGGDPPGVSTPRRLLVWSAGFGF